MEMSRMVRSDQNGTGVSVDIMNICSFPEGGCRWLKVYLRFIDFGITYIYCNSDSWKNILWQVFIYLYIKYKYCQLSFLDRVWILTRVLRPSFFIKGYRPFGCVGSLKHFSICVGGQCLLEVVHRRGFSFQSKYLEMLLL